jgi:hypothetical protein
VFEEEETEAFYVNHTCPFPKDRIIDALLI